MNLYDIAPRLALARDQHNNEQLFLRAERRDRIHRRVQLERLVAHRELQLIRAEHAGGRRYIATWQRKLAEARAALERFERRAA